MKVLGERWKLAQFNTRKRLVSNILRRAYEEITDIIVPP
jgi:hypothetical protein